MEKPRHYLFSFTGLIDALAVLFFFVPQVRSELLLWVFKLLKFIDAACTISIFCSSSSCCRWCLTTAPL